MMWAVGFLATAALGLVVGQSMGWLTAPEAGTMADLARWVALLAVIGWGVGRISRGRMGEVLTSAVVWVGIGLALVAGYSYRTELAAVAQRVGVELMPSGTLVASRGDVRVRRAPGGHYDLVGKVDGTEIDFTIDTGATHTTLNHGDAARIGLDVANLRYTVPVSTANGMTFAAPAVIDRLDVGPIGVENIRVLVAQPGALSANLLGLNFLDTLASYEVRGRTMTLRPRG